MRRLRLLRRISIAEVLPVDDQIRALIMRHGEVRLIHQQGVKSGMRTIFEDGMRKALEGQITVEEVVRETVL